jgi:hypothetical protein
MEYWTKPGGEDREGPSRMLQACQRLAGVAIALIMCFFKRNCQAGRFVTIKGDKASCMAGAQPLFSEG